MHTRSKFRLLVVRLGAMGDILHALPAVTALRQMHPEWVIDWVVEPRWRALLAAESFVSQGLKPGDSFSKAVGTAEAMPFQNGRNPAQPVVDRLHLAATKEWRKTPLRSGTLHEIKDLRQALRAEGYDVSLDLQGAVRSATIARLAGCRRRIGEAEPREAAARVFFTEQVATQGAHVIEQDIELAAAVAGDDLKHVQPWLPVDVVAEAWADALLNSGPGSAVGQPAVLINPGAGWGAKRWPVERYADVAQALSRRGLRVVVNAGPGEEPLAEAIVSGSGGAAIAVNCSLDQLIALTRRVRLAIAGDTGPLHLACALGKPVVGIYGPTDPSRNGPYGTEFRVLRSPESCRDHTRHKEPEAGLLTIQPDEVIAAADELLKTKDMKEAIA